MAMRLTWATCLMFCSTAFATEDSISEKTVGMEAFLRDVGTYGLSQEWPSLVIYNRQGLCAYRGVPDVKWDAVNLAEASDRKDAQKGCDLVAGNEAGSSKPQASDRRLVLFYTLDAPFCDNCRKVEAELRQLQAADPKGWTIRVTRVNFSEQFNPVAPAQ